MANKIIIVGGGPAGMMAGITAALNGGEVTILERQYRVGKKLLATGNGRCNYTNINLSINNYHGNNPKFAYGGLSSFGVNQTIDFFEKLGITPAIEEGGKVFPLSFQSSSMLDVLRLEMERLNIDLITGGFVNYIEKKKNFIVGIKDGRRFNADRVILATGGMALPSSGSDGNGYNLGKRLGHKVTDVFPGLVQLKLEGNIFKQVKGVKLLGRVSLFSNDRFLLEDFGDVLFTDYGISGPPVLQLSRTALDYLRRDKDIRLRVSIISSKTREELQEYLNERFSFMPERSLSESLIGLVNKRLIIPILKEVNLDKDKKVGNLSNKEISLLAEILTSWEFKVIGSQSWGQAQVTAGGVSTEEIHSKTMESKLVEGLYIVGELLDIDGDCGGFNLQWAWSSGYIAGLNSTI